MDRRDRRETELQLAALTGALHAAIEQGQSSQVQILSGAAATLAWVLGMDPRTQVGCVVPVPDDAALVGEYARAAHASLFAGPEQAYATGIHEALRWLLCQRDEPLVSRAA